MTLHNLFDPSPILIIQLIKFTYCRNRIHRHSHPENKMDTYNPLIEKMWAKYWPIHSYIVLTVGARNTIQTHRWTTKRPWPTYHHHQTMYVKTQQNLYQVPHLPHPQQTEIAKTPSHYTTIKPHPRTWPYPNFQTMWDVNELALGNLIAHIIVACHTRMGGQS